MRRASLAALALASLALAAVPTARADTITTTLALENLAAPSEAIRPLSGMAIVEGKVVYTYPGPAAASTLAPTKVTLRANAPAWASAIVSPSTLYINPDKRDPSSTVEGTFKVLITLSLIHI